MKYKILSSLAAISLALLLCSCGNNDDEPKNTEPTDAITTAISFTEAPAETSAEEAETVFTDSPADILLVSNAQMLDTMAYNGEKLMRLYFLGDKNGDTWRGSLFLRDETPDRKHIIYYIFRDETFDALTPPAGSEDEYMTVSDNGFLHMARDDILVFRRMINGRNTLRLYVVSESGEITPISIIPDDDCKDMFNSEYEFCADNFYANFNTYIHYGTLKNDAENYINDNYAYGCYSYTEDKYIEYAVNPHIYKMAITGSIPLTSNNDVTAAAAEAEKAACFGEGYELSFDYSYQDHLTLIGEDAEREETYYRLSPEIASDRESLTALIRSPFTDRCADAYGFTEEQLFDVDYPCFMADDEGIIYVAAYRGVPVRTELDSIRMTEADDSTAHAISYGHSLDGTMLSQYDLVKENGHWKTDRFEKPIEIGDYFGYAEVMRQNFDAYLRYVVRPDVFGITAGKEFISEVAAPKPPTGASMAADTDGNVIIGGFVKAEDFTGIDLSPLSDSAPNASDISREVSRTFTYTPEESGKYILWAACRYYTADGESYDLILGPQTVHVH